MSSSLILVLLMDAFQLFWRPRMNSQTSTDFPAIRKSDETLVILDRIQDAIREHAYRIFNDRSPTEGDSISDWLEAESEVLSDIDLKMEEGDCSVVIEGPVDGFLAEEIEARVRDGVLEIAGQHTEHTGGEQGNSAGTSSKQTSFFSVFRLPESLDTDKMEVTLDCGKLAVRIPRLFH